MQISHLNSVVICSFLPPDDLFTLISNDDLYEDNSKEIKLLRQYLTILEFPELEHFDTTGLSCFKELATLIEKTNGNHSTIDIGSMTLGAEVLIKAIANNCPRIKKLSIGLVPEELFM